jgi:hypothetical protein
MQIFQRIVCEVLRKIYAGIVDQSVQRSEFALGALRDLFCRCGLGDVTIHQLQLVGWPKCT